MHENMISIYSRTLKNCEFCKENRDDERLLNEVGVLRGIVYCVESAIGEANIGNVIDFDGFLSMIAEQNRILKK